PNDGGGLPPPLWERVGVRGYGLSMVRNPSPGSHLRCDIAEALLRRSFPRTVAEGDLCPRTVAEGDLCPRTVAEGDLCPRTVAEGDLCSPTRGEVIRSSRDHATLNSWFPRYASR